MKIHAWKIIIATVIALVVLTIISHSCAVRASDSQQRKDVAYSKYTRSSSLGRYNGLSKSSVLCWIITYTKDADSIKYYVSLSGDLLGAKGKAVIEHPSQSEAQTTEADKK